MLLVDKKKQKQKKLEDNKTKDGDKKETKDDEDDVKLNCCCGRCGKLTVQKLCSCVRGSIIKNSLAKRERKAFNKIPEKLETGCRDAGATLGATSFNYKIKSCGKMHKKPKAKSCITGELFLNLFKLFNVL